MTDAPELEPALDIYEVANQLEGYVGPDTPEPLAQFLLREGREAAKLADEIVRLRAARSAPEAGKAVDETALIAEMLTALKQSAAQFSQYTKHRRLTADEQFAFDSARLAIAKFDAKPLEWTAETPYHVARALGGHYSIERVDSDVTYFELKGSFVWPAKKLATIKEAKDYAQADYEQRILAALASSPAPTGAKPVAWQIGDHGALYPTKEAADKHVAGWARQNTPCASPRPLYARPHPVAPTGEIARFEPCLVGTREDLADCAEHSEGSYVLYSDHLAALTASEAEAADLRRKLEEHQDAEDKAAREMATVIQGLRNRATAAERKLEEARNEPKISGAEDELLIQWPGRVSLSISKGDVGYAIMRDGNWAPGKHIVFDAPQEAAEEIARTLSGAPE